HPTRVLPQHRRPGQIGKEYENAAGEKADTFEGKQCDPLHLTAFRLTIRMTNLLILRSLSQSRKRRFIWRIAVNHEKQAPSVRQQQLLDGASARDDVGDVLVWIGTRPSSCGRGVRWCLFLRSALSNWRQVASENPSDRQTLA